MKNVAGRPFVIVGVNSDKDRARARQAVESEHLDWPNVWAGPAGTSGPIPARWNIRAWPTLYVIDQRGVIRHRGHGEGLEQILERWVRAAEQDDGDPDQR